MRLLNYLSFSGLDENTNKFRALNIKLVDKTTIYSDIVNEISEKHNIKNINNIIPDLNKKLKNIYRGKHFFDFCIDEGSQIDKLKLGKKDYEKLKISHLEANDTLNSYKKQVESKLQQSKTPTFTIS
jgi:hypothetical protein